MKINTYTIRSKETEKELEELRKQHETDGATILALLVLLLFFTMVIGWLSKYYWMAMS